MLSFVVFFFFLLEHIHRYSKIIEVEVNIDGKNITVLERQMLRTLAITIIVVTIIVVLLITSLVVVETMGGK